MSIITTKNVFRQCAVQKKMFPREELFRLVRTKKGEIFFDGEYKIFGRGIHFHKDKETVENFFNPRKRGMVSHFLKVNILPEKFEGLKDEVEKIISSI